MHTVELLSRCLQWRRRAGAPYSRDCHGSWQSVSWDKKTAWPTSCEYQWRGGRRGGTGAVVPIPRTCPGRLRIAGRAAFSRASAQVRQWTTT